jgi:hypothetical protein
MTPEYFSESRIALRFQLCKLTTNEESIFSRVCPRREVPAIQRDPSPLVVLNSIWSATKEGVIASASHVTIRLWRKCCSLVDNVLVIAAD